MDERIEALDALAEKATPGVWQAWRSGNSEIADGTLVGQSELRPVPRPYNEKWIGYRNEQTARERHHTTMLRDDDADFIAALVNAWRTWLRDVALRGIESEAVPGERSQPEARDASFANAGLNPATASDLAAVREFIERIANTPIRQHCAAEDLARLQIDAIRLLQSALPLPPLAEDVQAAVKLAYLMSHSNDDDKRALARALLKVVDDE